MIKTSLIISSILLIGIGCNVMFKRDLSDLILVPVYAGNLETASEFRSLFAGSFLAYGYLILRYTFSRKTLSIAMMLTYIMLFIALGRIISFIIDGYTHLMHSKLLLFESEKYATIIVGRRPIINIIDVLSSRLIPEEYSPGELKYLEAYANTIQDFVVTERERELLANLAAAYEISEDRLAVIEENYRESLSLGSNATIQIDESE